MKVLISVTSIAFVVGCTMAHAQYTEGTIKIGVMNDMSGLYSDITGRGSLWLRAWPLRISGRLQRA